MNKRAWKKLFSLTALALALVITLAACQSNQPGNTGEKSQAGASENLDYNSLLNNLPANSAPSLANFSTISLEGERVTQANFSDHKLTMINIWATFCGPCIREMPELGEISREYKEKGLQIVGIISDVQNQDGSISNDQISLAKEIIDQTQADYLHVLPSYDLYQAKLKQVYSVPETVFVDQNGKVVGQPYLGSRSKDKWTAIIDQLLAEVA